MTESSGLSGMPPDREGPRRVLLVGSIAVAVLAAGALGAWALWFRGDGRRAADNGVPSYEHAQPTTSGASAEQTANGTPGSAADTSPVPGGTGSTQPTTAGPAKAPPVTPVNRQPYVVYRLGGRIVVAREDGSSPKDVASSAAGVFALSPDGRTLAVVDFTLGKLQLVDVATLATVVAGRAAQVAPVWFPDSRRVLFVRDAADHSQSVCQVSRTGADLKVLGAASKAAVSPDGRVVALAASASATARDAARVVLLRDGRPWRTLTAPGPVTDLALAAARAYAAVAPGSTSAGVPTEGVWALSFDADSEPVRLVPPGAAGERGMIGMLALSPDTLHLAYARAGDDGYSRMEIVPTVGGVPVLVASRKDTYPTGWSADSSAAFLIEGNAWQGEATALVRVRADGTGKATLVSGAGR